MADRGTTADKAGDGDELEEAAIREAVEAVIADRDPDQIILFGSAAAGSMRPDSDIDLLVLTNNPGPGPARIRWRKETGARIRDVLATSTDHAEAGRHCAGDVRMEALSKGRTIYRRPGRRILEIRRVEEGMVHEPDKAPVYLESAQDAWNAARSLERDEDGSHGRAMCQHAQQCMELSLKALIVAQGATHKFSHDLRGLWDSADALGEDVPGRPPDTVLDELTLYSGRWQYDRPETPPDETWSLCRKACEELLEHAKRRAPELAEETRRIRRGAVKPPARGGGPPGRGA